MTLTTQPWTLSHCGEQAAVRFAQRHYSARKRPQDDIPGKVGGPGRQLVLTAGDPLAALWITTWQAAEVTDHAWGGAWMCSLFRSEGGGIASELIRAAVAVTRWRWPDVPALGMITFIDREKVRPTKTRGEDTWGRTYRLAGIQPVGETAGGLLVLQLLPDRMPSPMAPIGSMMGLFQEAA